MGSLVEVREHRGLDARNVAFNVAERQNVVLDNRRTQEIAKLARCGKGMSPLCAEGDIGVGAASLVNASDKGGVIVRSRCSGQGWRAARHFVGTRRFSSSSQCCTTMSAGGAALASVPGALIIRKR